MFSNFAAYLLVGVLINFMFDVISEHMHHVHFKSTIVGKIYIGVLWPLFLLIFLIGFIKGILR